MLKRLPKLFAFQKPRPINVYLSPLWALMTVFSFAVAVKAIDPVTIAKYLGGNSTSLAVVMAKLRLYLSGGNIAYTIAFGFLWKAYHSFFSRSAPRINAASVIMAVIFAGLFLLGTSYNALNSWDFIFLGYSQLVLALIMFGGFYMLFFVLLSHLFAWIDTISANHIVNVRSREIDRYFFAIAFLFIIACWLPYLITFFPGSVAVDSANQIRQILGTRWKTTANPVFVTCLMGNLFLLGRNINDNFGIFLNVLLQTMVCALAFAGVCNRIRKISDSPIMSYISICSIFFYGLVPTWGSAVQCLLKDVIHTGFFIWFLLEYTSCLFQKEMRVKDVIFLTLSMLVTIFTRKTALYIVVPCCLALIAFGMRGKRGKCIIATLVVIAIYFSASNWLYQYLGFATLENKDSFSLPFQQTALYCKQYGDEMTQKDIDTVNSVLNYDEITANYNPILADPVKNTYHGTPETMAKYWSMYIRLFFRHPDAYLQAMFNNAYGYFLPTYTGSGTIRTSIADGEGDFDVFYVENLGARSVIMNYVKVWAAFPFLHLMLGPGTYAWILLICFCQALRKKDSRYLLSLFPSLFLLFGCIFSPVNGEVRYAYPITASIPLMIAYMLRPIHADINALS